MGWLVSMHGSTDHLDPEVADEAEVTLRDKLAEVFSGLVAAGHQGVAGVFHHSHGSPVDLRSAGAPAAAPDASEAPSEPEAASEPVNPTPAATAPENAATEDSAPEG